MTEITIPSKLDPIVRAFYFDLKPLDQSDALRIDKILADGFQPGAIKEDQVGVDAQELKNLTAEIKSINKQWVVLTAERVAKVKEILKPYKEGTFTKWLETTFGSYKTGFNFLSYYELYSEYNASVGNSDQGFIDLTNP